MSLMPRKKKKFFEKKKTKETLLIAFVVAFVLMAIDALRFVATFVIKLIFDNPEMEKIAESYGYLVGFAVGIFALILLISNFSNDIE